MKEEATAAMANLELCRELYPEEQRRQFYAVYQEARMAAKAAADELFSLEDPRGWRFWQRPKQDWLWKRNKLDEAFRKARLIVQKLEEQHPLLAKVFIHRGNPV
ncbi:hypothetical protein I4I80_02610 [Pseudomonas syringae pv. tomato]|nr:hypothetical protein [Pseudomonas syringae pv. tomato]MBW8023635.1 hypothetical protein [Pseudomonas syringae pv. tomato]